jgi:hypothetical protein
MLVTSLPSTAMSVIDIATMESFEQHKKEVCQTVYKCLLCNKIIKIIEETEHKCGYEICVNCKRKLKQKVICVICSGKKVKV